MSKPVEAEELVDRLIHRPLARPVVALLVRTPITPNQVTLLSAAVGVAGGVILGRSAGHPGWRLGAALLLLVSVVLDCCDGQLARARGISSTTGAILDGVADYAVGFAMALGASAFMVVTGGSPWFWLLGLAGTVSAAVHSALFDHAKTRYLARIGGHYSEREEDLARVARERDQARAERRRMDVLLLWLYERYSRAQHASLRLGPATDPAAYRLRYAGRMQLWTFLGIGTHFALAYLLCAVAYWWPGGVALYMALCATLFNFLLLGLIHAESRQDAE